MPENCRICRSENIISEGFFQPYKDYSCEKFLCFSCRSVFTNHDASVYEKMHANRSGYFEHETKALAFKNLSKPEMKKNIEGSEINKFIIDIVEQYGKSARIAEVGCSTGIITHYLNVLGYEAIGFDVSSTAIQKAKNIFADHYYLFSEEEFFKHGKFDVIFHLGTIGCVKYPKEFNSTLVRNLRKNGTLAFNAPNVAHLAFSGKPWLTTPPPDLVTLFHEDFFKFSSPKNCKIYIKTLRMKFTEWVFSSKYLKEDKKISLFENGSRFEPSPMEQKKNAGKFKIIIKQIVKSLVKKIIVPITDEYGILVEIKKLGDSK